MRQRRVKEIVCARLRALYAMRIVRYVGYVARGTRVSCVRTAKRTAVVRLRVVRVRRYSVGTARVSVRYRARTIVHDVRTRMA